MKYTFSFLSALLLSLQPVKSEAQSVTPVALAQLEFILQDTLVDYREVYTLEFNGGTADTTSQLFIAKNQDYITSGYELLDPDSLPWDGNRKGNINEITGFTPNGVDSIFREDLYKDGTGRDTLYNVFLDTGRFQLDLAQQIKLIYGAQGIDTFRIINYRGANPNFDFAVVRDAQQRTDSLYIYLESPQGTPVPVQAYEFIYTPSGNRIDTINTLNVQNNFSVITKIRPSYDNASGKIEKVDILEPDGSGEFSLSQRIIFSKGGSMDIADKPKMNSLSLYPNPSQDIIRVKGFSGSAELNLLSINGQQLKSWDAVKAATPLSIADLQAGNYMLRVETKEHQYRLTFSKE